jgi:hypothetical protein
LSCEKRQYKSKRQEKGGEDQPQQSVVSFLHILPFIMRKKRHYPFRDNDAFIASLYYYQQQHQMETSVSASPFRATKKLSHKISR